MTVAEFKADFPEFASEKAEVVTRHIGYAPGFFDESRWEAFHTRGLGNWVAHSIVMEKRRMAAGPVADAGDLTNMTQESTNGGVGSRVTKSRSADAVKRAQENHYFESQYGREYMRLAKIVGKAAVAI